MVYSGKDEEMASFVELTSAAVDGCRSGPRERISKRKRGENMTSPARAASMSLAKSKNSCCLFQISKIYDLHIMGW